MDCSHSWYTTTVAVVQVFVLGLAPVILFPVGAVGKRVKSG